MADEMMTSCPLCSALDEAESMVVVAIERAIPKERVEICLCRKCVAAVVRAALDSDEPLAPEPIEREPGSDQSPAAAADAGKHEEADDDPSTD